MPSASATSPPPPPIHTSTSSTAEEEEEDDNFDVHTSLLPNKDALLFDAEICTALGMQLESGVCLRHPNICIYESSKKEKESSMVHICRICDSETKAGGGLQHRKSFALAITEIQQIHGTPEWQKFKDNWGAEDTIEECAGGVCEIEEKKEIVFNEASITFVADKEQASNSIETRHVRPSAMMRQNNMPRLVWTREILARVAQVAAWKTASQAAEMELMEKEMIRLKDDLIKAQENSVNREIDLQSLVAKQAAELETLQLKCDKQERHINKELRMIKTIAMKRASSRGSIGDSANSGTTNANSNVNNASNNNNNTTPISPGPSTTSANSNDRAMKQPSRQPSENVAGIHDIQSPTTTATTSEVTGSSATGALPIRTMSSRDQQFSSLTLTDVSAFNPAGKGGLGSAGALNVASNQYSTNQFDLATDDTHQDKAPPSQPQRLPSHDTGVTTVSDLTSSLAALEFVTGATGTSGDGSITFVPSIDGQQRNLDIHQTTPSSVLTGGSGRKYATSNGHTNTIAEADNEEEESTSERMDRVPSTLNTPSTRRQTRADVAARPNNNRARGKAKSDMTGLTSSNNLFSGNRASSQAHPTRNASDQEISFFPTDAEAAAAASVPPPPPPEMTSSPQRSTTQEIEFDVSREFSSEGVDKRRKSLMGMKFDHSSQRLLMEASAALADPTMTPLSVSHRKTVSQSPAVTQHKKQQRLSMISSQAHRDIDLGNGGLGGAANGANVGNGANGNNDSFYDKTEEEILNEKIFGKVEKATPENELDDEYDYFEDLPSDLGLSNEGYLQVRNSVNLSPVSAITTGSMSYLMDHGPGGLDADDEEDEDGPRKGLHQGGFAKRLPMEEDFDSDDDDSKTGDRTNEDDGTMDTSSLDGGDGGGGPPVAAIAGTNNLDDDDSSNEGGQKPPPVKLTSSHSGSPGTPAPPAQLKSAHPNQRHRTPQQQVPPSTIVKPTAQKSSTDPSTPVVALRSLSEGFNKEGHHLARPHQHRQPHSRAPAATLHVENEIVQDKYGDGGIYTGNINKTDRLPHGNGKMAYDNERQYDGEWRKGRWHGIGKWVNPNGDCYEGTFVYDARHGRGIYTWKNGNVYKGDFHEDKRQGKGTFNFANGNVYEGDFINGVFEGQGKYSFEGGFYEGGWKGGRYHDHGFLKFGDGSSYTGEFVDGVAHGRGEEKAADGTVRTGVWENGRPI